MNNDNYETDNFIHGGGAGNKYSVQRQKGCCYSKHTRNCCIATSVFGGLFVILGVVVLLMGKPMLEKKILKSMALTPGSDRLASWLEPPVQPFMEAYAFHVKNPDEVLEGQKPILQEIGPFVYRSDTVKDSDDNMKFSDGDKKLTYRPRKLYYLDKGMSEVDPETTYVTVPNIPYWTGLNQANKKGALVGTVVRGVVTGVGLNKPFINVTLSGLLWGYHDELPCAKLDRPSSCPALVSEDEEDEDDMFGGGDDGFGDDGFGDDGFGDDGFGDDGFGDDDGWGDDWGDDSETEDTSYDAATESSIADDYADHTDFKPPKDSKYEKMVKPKAEIVDCKCQWGLFRDRNVTMRKPSMFMTGLENLAEKGQMVMYDGKKELEWWKQGTMCDKVGGNDGSTLPPGLNEQSEVDMWIALMCRSIKLKFEKHTEHAGIKTLRFIPARNALGSHDDENEEARNPDNECFCMQEEGYHCFKSGVMYMEPCKRETFAPLALSMPHFYQAHPSFTQAVHGLSPSKEKHEFYMDVVPEFGFPLAIQPKFQLNLVIGRDENVDKLSNMENRIVLPFLWAKIGFTEPPEAMSDAIKFGLNAPDKLPLLGAVAFFVLGGILLLIPLCYFLWRRRADSVAVSSKSAVQMMDIKPTA